MNEIGIRWLYCALQVTIVSTVALAILMVSSRRVRGQMVWMASWAVICVVILSLVAWSPWPRWKWRDSTLTRRTPVDSAARDRDPESSRSIQTDEIASRSRPSAGSMTVDFLRALREELLTKSSDVPSAEPAWRWTGMLAMVAGVWSLIGLIRILGGWWVVRRLVRRSAPIRDRIVVEQLDIVCAELSCRATPAVVECPSISTAATVGWRAPVVLLPPNWRSWTPEELRSVLAHETAHIRRQDFIANALAQVGLALHFYHPLVHSLVGQLRLELELAADAAAAQVVGRKAYLESLARMALRQSECSLGWPARTFLPTHGTFLRRLEMLRDAMPSPNAVGGKWKWVGYGVLVLAFAIASGLRAGGVAPATAWVGLTSSVMGQQPAADSVTNWIPGDAAGIAVLDLDQMRQSEGMLEIVNGFWRSGPIGPSIRAEDVAQISISFHLIGERQYEPILINARLKVPKKVTGALQRAASPESRKDLVFLGQPYVKETPFSWFQPDDGTLIVGPEPLIKLAIASGKVSKSKLLQTPLWTKVSKGGVAVVVDMDQVRKVVTTGAPQEPWLQVFAPLWKDTNQAHLRLGTGKDVDAEIWLTCSNREQADRVRETAESVLTLAKNAMQNSQAFLANAPENERKMAEPLMDLGRRLLANAKTTVSPENAVSIAASAGGSGEVLRTLTQAAENARTAARRTNSVNNLKLLMLAMHNFHDVHGHFPAAVTLGKDGSGGPPHSWRIDLLPYLEMNPLYETYRFDEPWDSDENKKILAKIPPVFRCPMDGPDSTHTSYFALVGKATMFSKPTGIRLTEVVDGTSNSIALVEAKRAIPWTKPDDIPYAADKPIPQMGGWYEQGFLAGLGDGSVRFIPQSIDPNTLRLLISISDGQTIPNF